MLKMLLFLGVFFLLVFIIAMLMLPDRGRSLLRLGSLPSATQVIAMAPAQLARSVSAIR